MGALFDRLTGNLWRQVDGRIGVTLVKIRRTAKKIGLGLICFQISAPLFLIGLLWLLAALFVGLKHFDSFIVPFVWTGLASVGGGILFLIFGLLVLL